jgi:hypothetical protein
MSLLGLNSLVVTSLATQTLDEAVDLVRARHDEIWEKDSKKQ